VKKLWWAIIIVVFLGIEGVQVWQFLKLRKDLADLKWSVAVAGHDDDNVITPDVGTIQFLKRGGYSIQLDTAKYTNPITSLSPGGRQPFNITIPNVKQTKEGIRLVVVFTGGERYSYGP
jgi:hypothetical protein